MALINFDKVLAWTDFPNKVPEPGASDTFIESATIGVSWRRDIDEFVKIKNDIGLEKYTVTITIEPTNCAVRQSLLTGDKNVANALLKHEQGHYDIMALGAREFHNKMADVKASSEKELTEKLDALDEQIRRRANNKDSLYDTNTEHSRNTAQQATWNAAITAQKRNPKGTVDNLPS